MAKYWGGKILPNSANYSGYTHHNFTHQISACENSCYTVSRWFANWLLLIVFERVYRYFPIFYSSKILLQYVHMAWGIQIYTMCQNEVYCTLCVQFVAICWCSQLGSEQGESVGWCKDICSDSKKEVWAETFVYTYRCVRTVCMPCLMQYMHCSLLGWMLW